MLDNSSTGLVKGYTLTVNQAYAMLKKKMLYTMRNWLMFAIQLIIPICFMIITILMVRTWNGYISLPSMNVDIRSYRRTTTLLRTHDITPDLNEMADNYESIFADLPENHQVRRIADDVEETLLSNSKNGGEFLVTAEFQNSGITAWFNNQPYHVAPLSLNLIHNAMIKY